MPRFTFAFGTNLEYFHFSFVLPASWLCLRKMLPMGPSPPSVPSADPRVKIVLCLGLVRHSISEAFFITVLWHQLQKYSPVVLVRATTCFSYFNSDAVLNQIYEKLSSHRRFKTGLGFSYCDLYFLMSSLMAWFISAGWGFRFFFRKLGSAFFRFRL